MVTRKGIAAETLTVKPRSADSRLHDYRFPEAGLETPGFPQIAAGVPPVNLRG